MRLEALRQYCLSLPGTDEIEQWEVHILFRVGTRMFCISTFEPTNYGKIGFKCSPQDFAELIERENVIPSPYMARNHWVTLTDWDALPAAELKGYLRRSYDLIVSKLPKKLQASLATGNAPAEPKPAAKAKSPARSTRSAPRRPSTPKSTARTKGAGRAKTASGGNIKSSSSARKR